jgi:hypothetical protein
MNRIMKIGARIMVFAALLALGSLEARAQEWPTTQQLRCDWTRTNTGAPTFGGKAKVTLTYDFSQSTDFRRNGTMRTEYPDGSVNTVTFKLYWDFMAANNRFILETSTGVTCNNVRTFEWGTIVAYDACVGPNQSFQSFQYCRY